MTPRSEDGGHDHPGHDHDHGPRASEVDPARYEGVTDPVVRRTSVCGRELLAVVPRERLDALVRELTSEVARRVHLKGFRKGKAPLAHVRRLHEAEIQEKSVERLVNETWERAREAHGLRPIGPPVLEEISIREGEPIRFAARFEVLPEVELKGVDSIKVSDKTVQVTEKDLDAEMEGLREAHAGFAPSEHDDVRPGDFVVIDLERWLPGADRVATEPAEARRHAVVQVGHEGNLPELDRTLLGMAVGESRDFTTANPPTHPDPAQAGAEVPMRVKLHGIRERKLPALDDDLAKRAGGWDSLAQMREGVKEGLRLARREQALREQEAEAVAQLLASNPIEMPPSLVEREAELRLSRGLEDAARRGVDVESLNIDWKAELDRAKRTAARDLTADYLLELVAREKKVEVGEADVQGEIEALARRHGKPPEAVRAQLVKSNQLSNLRATLRRRRVLDLLRSSATLSED